MEDLVHQAEDLRRLDRVWQRVAPALPAWGSLPEHMPGQEAAAVPALAAAVSGPVPSAAAPAGTPAPGQSALLPGAEPDPCCMGSAAQEALEVLEGFCREELMNRCQLLALARCAPLWSRGTLQTLAESCAVRERRLRAAVYLITGTVPLIEEPRERIYPGRWLPALRERYHSAACTAMNYRRASEGTTDPCLARLLEGLSTGAEESAQALVRLLERSLRGQGGSCGLL